MHTERLRELSEQSQAGDYLGLARHVYTLAGAARRPYQTHSSSKVESEDQLAGNVPLRALIDISLRTQRCLGSAKVCVSQITDPDLHSQAQAVREQNERTKLRT